MRDYLDSLGVPRDAPAQQIRRASARHRRAGHPDFDVTSAGERPGGRAPSVTGVPGQADVAIDFPDLTAMIERMQAAFFSTGR